MLAAPLFSVCLLCASAPQTVSPTPLVLVPGFLGQREAGVMGPYFHGWREALTAAGADVYEVAPPPVASSAERGQALLDAIDAVLADSGARHVVLITHSQGGVDARWALEHGGADRIAAVATLAAPHAGTGVADVALSWPQAPVNAALTSLSTWWRLLQREPVLDVDARAALESLSLATRGSAATEVPRVPFFSVAGITGADVDGSCQGGRWQAPQVTDEMNPALVFGAAMIRRAQGAASNDGVVPTASMRFGTFLGCAPADHVDWQGWDAQPSFDVQGFVVELWRGLDEVARSGDAQAMDAHIDRLALLARARPRDG
jgi:hypothetical protein